MPESKAEEGTNFGPTIEDPMFACHKTPDGGERACAGWLVREGVNHPRIRLAVMTGEIPACALESGEDWPETHEDFVATRDHDLSGSVVPVDCEEVPRVATEQPYSVVRFSP
jgi:hypothetical protein